MSTSSVLADAARWMLASLLVLACAEKASSLRSHATGWHPIMLASAARRRFSRYLMGASLLGDVAAVLMLVAAPQLGAALTSALILIYTWAALPAHRSTDPSSCRCFLRVANTHTRLGLIIRNCWLIVASLAVIYWHPEASWAGLALGGVLLGGTEGLTVLVDRLAQLRHPRPNESDVTLRPDAPPNAPEPSRANNRTSHRGHSNWSLVSAGRTPPWAGTAVVWAPRSRRVRPGK